MGNENENCIKNIAEKAAKDWEGRDGFWWEDDRDSMLTFSGKCPLDNTLCQVHVDIADGKIKGSPRIVTLNDNCKYAD